MMAKPDVGMAKQLGMFALSIDANNDERAAAINLFMAGAMLLAFHASENPNADIDGLMDFVNDKCREAIREVMREGNGKLN